VIKVPPHLPNAVWGGLMSARASFLGAKGVVIEGNARDLTESQEMVRFIC
jgi:regulator of RNase E activity RraA